MKIKEFRDLIAGAERTRLEKAFAESYKHFTKSQKEEIDALIQGILAGKDEKTASDDAKKKALDFDALENEIKTFLQNAYEQNYFAPNRVIPKSQRPKWRFLVKGYIKALDGITSDQPEYVRAVTLLGDLYRMLCYACNYYLFSTEDPYRSVGWNQEELFSLLARKVFQIGYTRESIRKLLISVATDGVSREELPMFIGNALLRELKTSDLKYMAIEEAKKLADEAGAELRDLKKYDSRIYSYEVKINNLCDMVLMTAISLSEPELAVPYYFKNCRERNLEIVLYRALQIVRWLGDAGLWMEVYRYGITKKITPRDDLRKEFESLQAGEEMEKGFWF